MADKQVKKEKNQPLLYIQHLDLHKFQHHVQRTVIVKQTEQTAETKENEKEHVENSEQMEPIIEEGTVVDQHNMQTDVTEETEPVIEEGTVVDQHNMQTDVTEETEPVIEGGTVVNQYNMQTDVTEETEPVIEEGTAVDQHNMQTDVTEENQQKQNDEQFVESSSSTWQNKSFKDMNNEEKIYFLLNRPHYIPKVKCMVKTEKTSYVGVISSYENGMLQMVAPNQIGNFSLDMEEVVSIRIMGL
ncbi:CotO family spore coat protein [Bacillus sp. CGMCC 1.60114]|uniref:CotO family spore coat protein n=1 Tax=unclassified Bacillus (in: firmicutes) TaxID=185979 RepID=UPI00363EF40B